MKEEFPFPLVLSPAPASTPVEAESAKWGRVKDTREDKAHVNGIDRK